MKSSLQKHITVFVSFIFVFLGSSAQVNTFYFMKTVPFRHEQNPALQPLPNVVVGLPIISSFYFGIGNNSLSLNDIIYPKSVNGNMQMVTFLDENWGNIDKFYSKLKKNTNLYSDISLNLASFGFRVNKHYFTLGISQKANIGLYLPKNLFKLALYGADTIDSFNFNHLGISATSYLETALGYSVNINDNFSLGAKAKLLTGQANISIEPGKVHLDVSRHEWDLKFNKTFNITLPYAEYMLGGSDGKEIDSLYFANKPSGVSDYLNLLLLKPGGIGAAFDIGASYSLCDKHLSLSAALLDIGFIRWSGNKSFTKPLNINAHDKEIKFDGIEFDINQNGILTWDKDFFDKIKDSLRYTTTFNSYTTLISSKFLCGVEYLFLHEKMSVGLLSKSILINKTLTEELTASINFLPLDDFNAILSYTYFNGQSSSIGIGLGGRLGPVSLYVAGDYIPIHYSAQMLPYKAPMTNIQLGVALAFGRKDGDDDHDGVKNRKDQCPDTPLGVAVDEHGCPIDSDGDGIPDYLDSCPDTPAGVAVGPYGCPLDSDGDGIPDYLDKCPDTPPQAYGMIDEFGCPLDSDGDGIPDYLDKCPDTPPQAYGMIDEFGCPLDSDGDGVPDYLDQCPDTPVAAYGFIDENGCPKDTDGDGIPDYLDKCPETKGTIENNGCPEVKAAVKRVFEKALQGIQFETGKDLIKTTSFPILNQIATIMRENPDYLLTINGHTDNVGKPESNMVLSDKRAHSVKNYLIKQGIEPERLTAQGFGDTQPLVENTTNVNKAKNRRVEFIVKFER